MSHSAFGHTLATLQRAACGSDAIEWEELPSMADSLGSRLAKLGERHRGARAGGFALHRGTEWADTLPMAFDALASSQPFEETLKGLATREVTDPNVFRHFFG